MIWNHYSVLTHDKLNAQQVLVNKAEIQYLTDNRLFHIFPLTIALIPDKFQSKNTFSSVIHWGRTFSSHLATENIGLTLNRRDESDKFCFQNLQIMRCRSSVVCVPIKPCANANKRNLLLLLIRVANHTLTGHKTAQRPKSPCGPRICTTEPFRRGNH